MIKCSHKTVCSVCGLCPAHCVGHVSFRACQVPEQIPGECKALMRMSKGSLVMIGRSDTRLIPEEAREAAKPRRSRRPEQVAA